MSLTLDDLAATSGTAAQDLARKSKELTQKQPVVQVPIARTTERRAQRQLAYDETTKTVMNGRHHRCRKKNTSLNFGKREAEQTSTSQLANRSLQIPSGKTRRGDTAGLAHTDRRSSAGGRSRDDAEEKGRQNPFFFFAERQVTPRHPPTRG